MSDLVTVAAYLTPVEASILRGRLGAEGFFSFAVDEFIWNTTWVLSNGTRVQVLQGDFPAALTLKRACDRGEIDWRLD
jgi:hypothetical protein